MIYPHLFSDVEGMWIMSQSSVMVRWVTRSPFSIVDGLSNARHLNDVTYLLRIAIVSLNEFSIEPCFEQPRNVAWEAMCSLLPYRS